MPTSKLPAQWIINNIAIVIRGRTQQIVRTASDDQFFPISDPIKCAALSFNPALLQERYQWLDRGARARAPAIIPTPAASTAPKEQNATDLTDSNIDGNTDGDSQGSDMPRHLDLKNYVLQKQYHPTYDTHNHFRVTNTETLVLICYLPPPQSKTPCSNRSSHKPQSIR